MAIMYNQSLAVISVKVKVTGTKLHVILRLLTNEHLNYALNLESHLQKIVLEISRDSVMCRLNSGIRNRNNFFVCGIFLFQKIGNDSVNHADSGDIQFFVQFPGNSIFEFPTNF